MAAFFVFICIFTEILSIMGKVTVKFVQQNYIKREVMIPMRDGVRLYTAVYEPVGAGERPVIMIRTPFPLNPYGKTFCRDLRTYMSVFTENRYIIVFQNVRGRFMSEGEFVDVRPLEGPVNEATDTYDTAEWLICNLNTNGSIGVKGMSYPGFYATMAALSGHPAVKAVSPQAPVTDWFMGDDAHISGIPQLPLYPFGASFFRPRKAKTIAWPRPVVALPEGNLYDAFLGMGNRPFEPLRDKLPFIDQMLNHPTYDEFWKRRNAASNLNGKLPPFLVVAGFYDAEDCYGPFEVYRTLKEQVPDTDVFLCAGPWYHGAWKHSKYSFIGDVYFTEWSAEHFRESIEYPFFAYYLEGKGSLPSSVSILPSGETMPKGGRHIVNSRPDWEYMASWPPVNKEPRLFLSNGYKLSAKVPGTAQEWSFVSDPAHPVPYTGGVLESFSREAFVADQRFASRRSDVLTFKGPVIKEAIKVEGVVNVVLWLSVDRPDADIVVKLIDRRPDGYQLPVRFQAMPLRFRESFSAPQPAEPGKLYRLEIKMNDIAHIFMPGHRIMLQIQGSMFPLLALPQEKKPVKISLASINSAECFVSIPVCRSL